MSPRPTVFLVDDNEEMRESLVWMLRAGGFRVESSFSPADMLERLAPETPGCLVVEFELPGMDGLEFLRAAVTRGCFLPFIIITGNGDVSRAVQSMRHGAVDFLEKPFTPQQLITGITIAMDQDRRAREHREQHRAVMGRLESLTMREREVLHLVIDGMLTKQIARRLGISAKTVEVHRSNVARKMGVDSTTQLVRLIATHFPSQLPLGSLLSAAGA